MRNAQLFKRRKNFWCLSTPRTSARNASPWKPATSINMKAFAACNNTATLYDAHLSWTYASCNPVLKCESSVLFPLAIGPIRWRFHLSTDAHINTFSSTRPSKRQCPIFSNAIAVCHALAPCHFGILPLRTQARQFNEFLRAVQSLVGRLAISAGIGISWESKFPWQLWQSSQIKKIRPLWALSAWRNPGSVHMIPPLWIKTRQPIKNPLHDTPVGGAELKPSSANLPNRWYAPSGRWLFPINSNHGGGLSSNALTLRTHKVSAVGRAHLSITSRCDRTRNLDDPVALLCFIKNALRHCLNSSQIMEPT